MDGTIEAGPSLNSRARIGQALITRGRNLVSSQADRVATAVAELDLDEADMEYLSGSSSAPRSTFEELDPATSSRPGQRAPDNARRDQVRRRSTCGPGLTTDSASSSSSSIVKVRATGAG